ncbi:DUF2255 family protein [Gordonia sputi]|uniref:DUF2255 family protein n=1 Tax=Gordonia sputi NBRC 100414 TaxID=1089453 RepID=H5U3G5_9ACTN|nr:DUF2255 family protein [Gordonia sputi]NKY95926.1 DUF2255 family protein [Gordonia sputi]GAB40273.1 hypothetical protein GOSPT_096_00030 [Gordonia sputi NBRC 100414]
MSTWNVQQAQQLTAPQEVGVATRRRDGSVRTPRVIWIVRSGDRVFIRSTNGRGADWFRWAIATGTGQITSGTTTFDVAFREADGADLEIVDDAYRDKYGNYASIVDHLQEDGPRAATLEVLPG